MEQAAPRLRRSKNSQDSGDRETRKKGKRGLENDPEFHWVRFARSAEKKDRQKLSEDFSSFKLRSTGYIEGFSQGNSDEGGGERRGEI